MILAAAVAFSRLYLGYHWLSDVLGSWTLAGVWLAAVFTGDKILVSRLGGVSGPDIDPDTSPRPL